MIKNTKDYKFNLLLRWLGQGLRVKNKFICSERSHCKLLGFFSELKNIVRGPRYAHFKFGGILYFNMGLRFQSPPLKNTIKLELLLQFLPKWLDFHICYADHHCWQFCWTRFLNFDFRDFCWQLCPFLDQGVLQVLAKKYIIVNKIPRMGKFKNPVQQSCQEWWSA